MPATKKLRREEMIARHESEGYDPFALKSEAEVERVAGNRAAGSPPISIRLSKPLLERLDGLAQQQHRSRSNLIQHILWAYVHEEPE